MKKLISYLAVGLYCCLSIIASATELTDSRASPIPVELLIPTDALPVLPPSCPPSEKRCVRRPAPPLQPTATPVVSAKSVYKCWPVDDGATVCIKIYGTTPPPSYNVRELRELARAAEMTATGLQPGQTDLACQNSHGASACCKVIGEVNGVKYIECGY